METFYLNNIKTTIIKTKQFKTMNLNVVYQDEATKENIVKYTLLKRLLTLTSKKYPTKKEFSDQLSFLYGTNINLATLVAFRRLFIIFTIDIVNPLYFNDENLLKEALSFLYEIIYNPNIINGGFCPKEFEFERDRLIINNANIYNNKRAYSIRSIRELMLKEYDVIITSSEFEDILNEITPISLYNYYLSSLNSQINLYVVGNIDKEELIPYFLNWPASNEIKTYPTLFVKDYDETVKEKTEKQDIEQSQLIIGYFTSIINNSYDTCIMTVFYTMLGSSPSSLLDTIVREKHSLAYYVYSNYDAQLGILLVGAGIKASKKEIVLSLINEIISNFQNGNISQTLFNEAKTLVINNMKSSKDNPYHYFFEKLMNDYLDSPSSEQKISYIQNITIQDIIRVANTVVLKAIYFLEGEKNAEN